jgi:hypothetical protein
MPPPFSKNKRSKKPVSKQAGFNIFLALLIPEDGGDIFPRNVGWLSTDYMVLYPKK